VDSYHLDLGINESGFVISSMAVLFDSRAVAGRVIRIYPVGLDGQGHASAAAAGPACLP
jgi:hypothetical protein